MRTPISQQLREMIDKWLYMKLSCKGNIHKTEETAHRMGEKLW
jgi:hypothetical protein